MVRTKPLDANNPPVNPPLAPPAPKKNRFKQFFSNIFKTLAFWNRKSSSTKFVEKNFTFIKTGGSLVSQPITPLKPKKAFSVRPLSSRPISVNTPAQVKKEFTPALDEMGTSVHELMEKIYQGLTQKYELHDRIGHIDTGVSALPTYLKALAKVFVQTTNKASFPFIQILNNKNIPFHEAVQKNQEEITASVKKIFSWLVDPSVKNAPFKQEVHELLKKRLANLPMPAGQNLDAHYLQPLLDWTFISDFSHHPRTVRDDFHEDTFNAVIEELGMILLEKKIDSFDLLIKKTLGGQKLSSIVEKMFKDNFLYITDFLSERMAELIQHTEYAKTFDHAIHRIDAHIAAMVPDLEPKDFAKDPACHPVVKDQLEGKGTQSETIFVDSIIDGFYQLLLPKSPEENAISTIWENKIVPPEFQALLKESKLLFDQLLTPSMHENINDGKDQIRSMIENAIGNAIEKQVKLQIKKQIDQILTKLLDKKALDCFLSEKIFPLINETLIEFCMKPELENEKNLQVLTGLFDEFYKNKPASSEDLLQKIGHHLLDWSSKTLAIHGISKADKERAAHNVAESLLTHLTSLESDNTTPLLEKLKKFNITFNQEQKEIYGTIAVRMLFSIGKIDEKLLGKTVSNMVQGVAGDSLTNMVKEQMTQLLSNGLAPYSRSPDPLVNAFTSNLNQKFKSQKDVYDAFFSDKPALPKQPKDAQAVLQRQMELTSQLITAKLKREFESSAFLTKKAIGVISPKAINESLNTIYQKCFKDPQKLKSLVFTITEISLEAFKEGNKKIQK